MSDTNETNKIEQFEVNNYMDTEKIYIMDLISQLDNLGGEKDKDEFIKNYSKLKEQIEKTDFILSNNDDQDYSTYNIQELFNILESNSKLISKPDKLDIQTLKTLIKISKILEDKLSVETMNIIESK